MTIETSGQDRVFHYVYVWLDLSPKGEAREYYCRLCSEMFERLVISSFTVPVVMWSTWNSEHADVLHSLYESWDWGNPRGDNGGGDSAVAIRQKLRCCRKWPQAIRRCSTVVLHGSQTSTTCRSDIVKVWYNWLPWILPLCRPCAFLIGDFEGYPVMM